MIFIFQNCSSSSFSPIASSEGDVVDPLRLNNAKCTYDGKDYWHGDTIETYPQSSVAYDKTCDKQIHTCENGTFTGVIGFKECGIGVARDCMIGNDTIKHNAEVTRFESASVAYNQSCRSEVRRCTEGSSRKVASCADWHSQRANASWNCGKISHGIYGSGAPTAAQPSCCPQGYTVTNGNCHPIAQRGQACFGRLDCADGLQCETDSTSDSTPYGRTCQ